MKKPILAARVGLDETSNPTEPMDIAPALQLPEIHHFAEVAVFIGMELAGYKALVRLLNRPVPRPLTGRIAAVA